MHGLNTTFNDQSIAAFNTSRVPAGTLPGMHDSTHRLYLAAKSIKQVEGQTNVANLLGQSPQTVKNWEERGVSKQGALLAEQLLGVRTSWLLSGTGDMLPAGRLVPPNPWGVAHDMAHPPYTVPPSVTWEDVMKAKEPLPNEFVMAVPDDALAPQTPRGILLIFSTLLPPEPGKGVLVEASDGRRYVRRYGEGLGGEWEAQARNDAYVTLKSGRDGLALLAVVSGRMNGDV